jgi:hypothetical protein
MICLNCKQLAKHSVKIEGIEEIPLCQSCLNAVNKGLISESDLRYMNKVEMNRQTNLLIK